MTNELHEECGVFGVYAGKSAPVVEMTYLGLYALSIAVRRAAESLSPTTAFSASIVATVLSPKSFPRKNCPILERAASLSAMSAILPQVAKMPTTSSLSLSAMSRETWPFATTEIS